VGSLPPEIAVAESRRLVADDLMGSLEPLTIAVAGITGFRNRGVEALSFPCWPFLVSAGLPINHRAHLEPGLRQLSASPGPEVALASSTVLPPLRPSAPPARRHVAGAGHAIRTLLRPGPEQPGGCRLIDPTSPDSCGGHRFLIVIGGDVYSRSDGPLVGSSTYLSLIHTGRSRQGSSLCLLGLPWVGSMISWPRSSLALRRFSM